MTVAPPATDPSLDEHVAALRAFNRFFTRRIGALEEGLVGSPYSLTEARVLFELASRRRATASKLGEELRLDAGYLSRIVKRFEEGGLLRRAVSETDGRQLILALTPAGERAFAELDRETRTRLEAMLGARSPEDRRQLRRALDTVQRVLDDAPAPAPTAATPYLLRTHLPGDMGLVVSRQALLYAREYGWNWEYEALVSRIVADFLEHFDPARERCWIAERDGEMLGSVFVVKHPDRERVAKLRLLYVEPTARGLGIGRHLVSECTRFARAAGYDTLTLWTNSVLESARRIYENEGYRLVHEGAHRRFGKDLVEQTWELSLT